MNNIDWNKLAANILKSELKRKDIGYEQLASMLEKMGLNETQGSIANKLRRGTFQFAFFLQCASAIGISILRFDELLKDQKN